MLKLAKSEDLSNILEFAQEYPEMYAEWLADRSTIDDMIKFSEAYESKFSEFVYNNKEDRTLSEADRRRNLRDDK